jgi:hypothetical protein
MICLFSCCSLITVVTLRKVITSLCFAMDSISYLLGASSGGFLPREDSSFKEYSLSRYSNISIVSHN